MILSSSSIVHPVVFVSMKLIGEFTSLEEPTDESDIMNGGWILNRGSVDLNDSLYYYRS
jgi:hypothetical protein